MTLYEKILLTLLASSFIAGIMLIIAVQVKTLAHKVDWAEDGDI